MLLAASPLGTKKHLARAAPSLPALVVRGAVVGPRWSSLATRFAPTPIAPLGHSLRCVGGRPSAAPAVTIVPDAAADPSSRCFVRQALFRASLQGGLVRSGVLGRGARCQRLRRFYRRRRPTTPPLLVSFLGFLGFCNWASAIGLLPFGQRLFKDGCSCVAVCLPRPHSARPEPPSSCSASSTS